MPTSASKSSRAEVAARARPHSGSNFLVDLGAGNPRAESAGFCEVVFPRFPVDTGEETGDCAAGASPHLILRRGVTGTLDLYDWWRQARGGQAPRRRVVKIMLLDDDQRTVVWTWRFRNVRPVSLSYSPLQAMAPALLMETIELAFDDVEVA